MPELCLVAALEWRSCREGKKGKDETGGALSCDRIAASCCRSVYDWTLFFFTNVSDFGNPS